MMATWERRALVWNCVALVRCSFRCSLFGLLNAGFPLRSDVRTRVGAQPTQALPERSGGLGGFAESWRLGSRGRMRAQKGETNSKLLGGIERSEMISESATLARFGGPHTTHYFEAATK